MQRNFLEFFSRPEDTYWAKEIPEGDPRGAQPTWARQGALACPGVQLRPIGFLLVRKKSPKSYAVFGLHLILISCDVKNKQKTATGTGHYVNRLVPKNDIKLL